MPIEGMSGGDASQIARGDLSSHEGELGTLHGDRSAPEPELAPPRHPKKVLARIKTVGDGLLAPHMLASLKGASVDGLMGLHVGEVDEEFERFSGQHGLDARVVVGDLIRFGLFPCPLRSDVSDTDQVDKRTSLEDRKVLVGNAAAADDSGPDASGSGLRSLQRRLPGSRRESSGCQEGSLGKVAAGDRGGDGLRRVHVGRGMCCSDSASTRLLQGETEDAGSTRAA